MLLHLASHGQLAASFTATPLSGCAPLIVSFNNNSSGATSYSWNFNNGSPLSTLTSPTTTYTTPGTYTVTLTASTSSGSSTATATITVYAPPTVPFSAIDTLVCPGASVSFINISTPNAPGAVTYNWNFGDGTSSTAQNPSHVFPGSAYYSITLTVINSQGCSATSTLNAYIHVATPPVAMFVASDSFFVKLLQV